MKKLFRILLGLVVGALAAAVFGWLSWYVVDEGSFVGTIAAGLFGIMAVLGAILGFLWVVVDDTTDTPVVLPSRKGKRQPDTVNPVHMGAAMLVATSDNFIDGDDADVDFDDGASFD